MILNALIDYYNRLEADPDQEVAPFGFSREKISFCLVLERDGTLHQLEDVRLPGAKRPAPKIVVVPDRGGRSGTLIKPNLLWDNTGYVLGRDGKGNPDRARQMFEAFRGLHISMRERVNDDGLNAVYRFLQSWSPEQADALGNWEEACDTNLVFRLRGEHRFVHESPGLRREWVRLLAEEAESCHGFSLVTGQQEDLARLHPLIQGVAGAQTTGAAMASFNLDAFRSYGREKTYNAPVGVGDAFRYTTALNRLLADKHRRVRVGDATVVFWSDRPIPFEDMFRKIVNESATEDPHLDDRVHGFLERLKTGRPGEALEDANVPFYVLGLAPNASRLSVRFWLVATVGHFADRLARHVLDLEIDGARPGAPPLIIRRLLLETAREPKDIQPLLAGAVARAVLTGGPYPRPLFSAVIRRIHADCRVNHSRAAILKGFLIRNARIAGQEKEVPVSLDKDRRDPPYCLGRLFAALEKAQEEAHDNKLNRTIKDSYFGSAAATPANVFPRLMKLSQHHLAKLPSEPGQVGKRRTRATFERLLGEIHDPLRGYPQRLTLDEQGLFYVAYYHQRQDFFRSRQDRDSTDTTETE